MNKQKLIEQIADKGIAEKTVKMVIDAVENQNWLHNPGILIDPKNIKKGDRIRQELANGNIYEYTIIWNDDIYDFVDNSRYFLLNRPNPELPTEPGSVVRVYKNGKEHMWTRGKDGCWRSDNIIEYDDELEKFDWEIIA